MTINNNNARIMQYIKFALKRQQLHGDAIDFFPAFLDQTTKNHKEDNSVISRKLRDSCITGDVLGVLESICLGADIHDDNERALRNAAYNGHAEIVRLLIEEGADIHANNDEALRNAVEQGHLEVVVLLEKNGVDISEYKDSLLRTAAHNGHTDVADFLISKGANINAGYKGSALTAALLRGEIETAAMILAEYNTDGTLQNISECNDIAHTNPEIRAFLSALPTIAEYSATLTPRYAHAAAALAARAGIDVNKFLETQKRLLKEQYNSQYPAIEIHGNRAYTELSRPTFKEYVQEITDRLGMNAYTGIGEFSDQALYLFANYAVLPRLVPEGFNANDSKRTKELVEDSRIVAAAILCGNMNLEQIFAFSKKVKSANIDIPVNKIAVEDINRRPPLEMISGCSFAEIDRNAVKCAKHFRDLSQQQGDDRKHENNGTKKIGDHTTRYLTSEGEKKYLLPDFSTSDNFMKSLASCSELLPEDVKNKFLSSNSHTLNLVSPSSEEVRR